MDWRAYYGEINRHKAELLKIAPDLNEQSGIYVFYRTDESGFKFAYVGQAQKVLTRLAQHMTDFKQHIDKSLHTRKLFSEKNAFGWKVKAYNTDDLDGEEQKCIKKCAENGFQLYNKTIGSQGIGKKALGETERKGYIQGLHNGYEKCAKEIGHLFEKNLEVVINGKNNKIKQKSLEKFKKILKKS